jgi:metal-responsive CopG/Arc/MetJ family transcriptional regulator
MPRRKGLGLRGTGEAYGHTISVSISDAMADDLRAFAMETNAASMNAAIRELLRSGLERYSDAKAKYFKPEGSE